VPETCVYKTSRCSCNWKLSENYFVAAGLEEVFALAVDLVAGFAVLAAGNFSEARRARFLSRFAACDRLRVFSRALSLGIVELRDFRIQRS
jgi:hypothetical protein